MVGKGFEPIGPGPMNLGTGRREAGAFIYWMNIGVKEVYEMIERI
jgi:hypothetical protein